MVFRRREPTTTAREVRAFDDFHEWVLSLPWVVERPYALATPGVRGFGVECEPLDRRQLWLLTGLPRARHSVGIGLAVIDPVDSAAQIEASGWGRAVAPMPARHAMVAVYEDLFDPHRELEVLVLSAYGDAMS